MKKIVENFFEINYLLITLLIQKTPGLIKYRFESTDMGNAQTDAERRCI